MCVVLLLLTESDCSEREFRQKVTIYNEADLKFRCGGKYRGPAGFCLWFLVLLETHHIT